MNMTLAAAAILLLVTAADNGEIGQNKWCWVSASSDMAFCDYSSFATCMSANSGQVGMCVPRDHD